MIRSHGSKTPEPWLTRNVMPLKWFIGYSVVCNLGWLIFHLHARRHWHQQYDKLLERYGIIRDLVESADDHDL